MTFEEGDGSVITSTSVPTGTILQSAENGQRG